MPSFVGMNLQDAQDKVQTFGIFFATSHDLLGSRRQVIDSNWQVCTQSPAAGTRIKGRASDFEGKFDFGAVKLTENCPTRRVAPDEATAAPTRPAPSEAPVTLTLTPTAGPNDTEITIKGTGWTPGSTVSLTYFNGVGGGAGSSATAVVDQRGQFTASLTAHDEQDIPGSHRVTAEDGAHAQEAAFNATS